MRAVLIRGDIVAITARQAGSLSTAQIDKIIQRYNRRVNAVYQKYPELPINETLKKVTRKDILLDVYKDTRVLVTDRELARRLNQLEKLGESSQQKVTRIGKVYTVKYIETVRSQEIKRESARRERAAERIGIKPEQDRQRAEAGLSPVKFDLPVSAKDLNYQIRAAKQEQNRARAIVAEKQYKENYLNALRANMPAFYDIIADKIKNVNGSTLFQWAVEDDELFIDFVYGFEEGHMKAERILDILETHGL